MKKWADRTRKGYEFVIYEELDGTIFGRVKIGNEWDGTKWDAETGKHSYVQSLDLIPAQEPKQGDPVWVRYESGAKWVKEWL